MHSQTRLCKPDLCFAASNPQVIGGGLPVGAYGGRKDIMELVAPAGPMYQAGTLSGALCLRLRRGDAGGLGVVWEACVVGRKGAADLNGFLNRDSCEP
jgi:hypothetical protein